MATSFTGIVRGNAIHFEGKIGLPDGQVVSVILQPIAGKTSDFDDGIAAEFNRLSEEWKDATGHLSNISQKVTHPSYQAIVALGGVAIPFILRDLETQPNDWFAALEQITGHDPIPESSYGDMDEMATAWIEWGRGNGYEW